MAPNSFPSLLWRARRSSHSALAGGGEPSYGDGNTSNHSFQGFVTKTRSPTNIYEIIDSDWHQVHDRTERMQVHGASLVTESLYEKTSEGLASQDSRPATQEAVLDEKTTSVLQKIGSTVVGLLSSCLRRKGACSRSSRKQARRSKLPNTPRSLNKELHQSTTDGSHVGVTLEPTTTSPSGSVMSLGLTLSPAPGSRFSAFTLEAVLPDGYKISDLSPENLEGTPTTIIQHSVETSKSPNAVQQISRIIKGSSKSTISYQEVEYTRVTKSSIRGAGINTSRATWVAVENAGSKSGLEPCMQFKISLPTIGCPPNIKYRYTAEVEPATDTDLTSNKRRTSSIWSSDWIEEPL